MTEQEAINEQEVERPLTLRDVAMDNMCSTLKSAYRDWNRKKEGERKTA